ncbi:MAG: hydroxymethylglutaryl-CoA lyase [Deltaproteobacteria bacterium]|nr:hydroxymethylglutaryl-CoA lyase [Deltaproteobacteria bacterium]
MRRDKKQDCKVSSVVIEDQTLRDGIQNEAKILSVEEKLEIWMMLLNAGVTRAQVASFVNPRKVPQMANASEFVGRLIERGYRNFSVLVLNQRGLERAISAGCKRVEISISASDTHSRRNAGMSRDEAIRAMEKMVITAKRAGLFIRAGVQCAFGCRYEGKIAEEVVLDIVKRELDLGADEVALADTTGMGNPLQVQELSAKVLELSGNRPVFLHLHDTEGKGLANAFAALEVGVRHFDATVAGTGGCPFITGALGNVAMEDLVFMLEQMGIATGVDFDSIVKCARFVRQLFGKNFPGRMSMIYDQLKQYGYSTPG